MKTGPILTVGSLFAGIGGFDLAAERVGFQVKWQVEIDDYATRVLEKHWPDVRRYRDVREVHASEPKPYWYCGNCLDSVDIICGGFPCQDISSAGKGIGIDGERSGLWKQYDRLIGELRPRYVVVENVAALLARGLGRVLGDLASRGYDAEWDCIPASALGAPHQRDRVWIVAYPNGAGLAQRILHSGGPGRTPSAFAGKIDGVDGSMGDSDDQRQLQPQGRIFNQRRRPRHTSWWESEPDVGRVAHGVPARVDRLRGLGNAIVPAVAEFIFQRIKDAEAERLSA